MARTFVSQDSGLSPSHQRWLRESNAAALAQPVPVPARVDSKGRKRLQSARDKSADGVSVPQQPYTVGPGPIPTRLMSAADRASEMMAQVKRARAAPTNNVSSGKKGLPLGAGRR